MGSFSNEITHKLHKFTEKISSSKQQTEATRWWDQQEINENASAVILCRTHSVLP